MLSSGGIRSCFLHWQSAICQRHHHTNLFDLFLARVGGGGWGRGTRVTRKGNLMGNYSCSWQSFCYDLPFVFFVVFFSKKSVTIEKNTIHDEGTFIDSLVTAVHCNSLVLSIEFNCLIHLHIFVCGENQCTPHSCLIAFCIEFLSR